MSYPTMVTIPIQLDARITPNSRSHWRTKAKIQKDMKDTTYVMMQATGPHANLHNAPLPLRLDYIIGLGYRRKEMDDDNAKASLKYVQDAIAKYLGVNDKFMVVGTVVWIRDPEKRGFIRVLITPSSGETP